MVKVGDRVRLIGLSGEYYGNATGTVHTIAETNLWPVEIDLDDGSPAVAGLTEVEVLP